MKYFLLAAMIGVASDVSASCPKKLDGTWSGTQTNTTTGLAVLDGKSTAYSQTGNGLVTFVITGNTIREVTSILSESGPFGSITDYSDPGRVAQFNYDKANCKLTIDVEYDKLIFKITANGKVMNGVGFERKNCDNDGANCHSGVTKAFRLERE